jgi:hypothetical protein
MINIDIVIDNDDGEMIKRPGYARAMLPLAKICDLSQLVIKDKGSWVLVVHTCNPSYLGD